MKEKWIINYAKTIGKSHEIDGDSPCQDNVAAKTQNGVSVIALSDGCGSSKISQYGSKLTVDVLCNVLSENFDKLYTKDNLEIKKHINTCIIEKIITFIKENTAIIQDFKKNEPNHYADFQKEWQAFKTVDKIYPLSLFAATLQFVAVKENKAIIGRLGDGLIGEVTEGYIKILSSEDKIGVTKNTTVYPWTIMIALENKELNPWDWFEIIKYDNLDDKSLFLITSDGVSDVIIGVDNNTEKFIYPDEVKNIINNEENLISILEKQYKSYRGIYDDLSIVLMRRENVDLKGIIIREYNNTGKTIANEKKQLIEKREENEEDFNDIRENEFVLNEEWLNKINTFISDETFKNLFIKYVSIIVQTLEVNKQESFAYFQKLFSKEIDEYDFHRILIYAEVLDLFDINYDKKVILSR